MSHYHLSECSVQLRRISQAEVNRKCARKPSQTVHDYLSRPSTSSAKEQLPKKYKKESRSIKKSLKRNVYIRKTNGEYKVKYAIDKTVKPKPKSEAVNYLNSVKKEITTKFTLKISESSEVIKPAQLPVPVISVLPQIEPRISAQKAKHDFQNSNRTEDQIKMKRQKHKMNKINDLKALKSEVEEKIKWLNRRVRRLHRNTEAIKHSDPVVERMLKIRNKAFMEHEFFKIKQLEDLAKDIKISKKAISAIITKKQNEN